MLKHPYEHPDRTMNSRPVLCLTFDDGPDPVYTPQLLELLERWQVPAAFFVVGCQAASHSDLLHRMEAAGHTVGLHSNIHKSAYLMTPHQTAEDFRQSMEALRFAGLRPKYYRPPWGHATRASRRLAGQYGLTPVYWDVMAQDWKASITEDEILHRLLQRTGAIGGDWFAAARPGMGPGALVCLHDGRGRRQEPQRMVHALGRAVEIWKAEGFRFVTLEEYLTAFPKKAAWRRGL